MVALVRNAYRQGLKGVQVWLPVSLHSELVAAAAGSEKSIQEWLLDVVREKIHGVAGVGSADHGRVASEGGVVGSQRGGDRGGDSVSGVVGRRVDWERVLAAGRAAKTPAQVQPDPLEEIA